MCIFKRNLFLYGYVVTAIFSLMISITFHSLNNQQNITDFFSLAKSKVKVKWLTKDFIYFKIF